MGGRYVTSRTKPASSHADHLLKTCENPTEALGLRHPAVGILRHLFTSSRHTVRPPMKKRFRATVAIVAAVLLSAPSAARADVVLDWNAIAVATPVGNPFNQARVLAATQLAVFEAVNAINGGYEPYLGTVVAPAGASPDAAVAAAAHAVLKHYAPGSTATLDAARAASLAAIPDGPAKTTGITVGEAAAAAMIAARTND